MNHPSSPLPWTWSACARGWEADSTGGEHDYWLTPDQFEGSLPSSLKGTLLRNGPGGIQVHGTPLKHPIDGDGVVATLAFPGDGRVHFRSRYVDSEHRRAEAEAGQLLYRGQMGTLPPEFSRLGATVQMGRTLATGHRGKMTPFRNPSNTNVLYWGGKVLTAYETGLPHHLDPVTLETVGLDDLNGALKPLKSLAAHFRQDPATGNLVTLSARPAAKGHPATVMFSEFAPDWTLIRQQRHAVDGLNYVHDFAMTPSWFILQMTPFVSVDRLSVMKILSGLSSPGEQMRHYPTLPSRLVLIPRTLEQGRVTNSENHQPLFADDSSPVHVFHFGSAWEPPAGLTCTAVCLPEAFTMEWDHGVWLSNVSKAPGRLCRYTLALSESTDSGTVPLIRETIDPCSCEFPTADPRLHGSPHRYVFLMANTQPDQPLPYRDIVKCAVDGSPEREVWRSEGLVGEPVFAPRPQQHSDGTDGWLLVQLYRPDSHRTEFVVLDAQNIHAGPVCRLHLPHHLPFAFHGTFSPTVLSEETP